jgi:hypothetical protein
MELFFNFHLKSAAEYLCPRNQIYRHKVSNKNILNKIRHATFVNFKGRSRGVGTPPFPFVTNFSVRTDVTLLIFSIWFPPFINRKFVFILCTYYYWYIILQVHITTGIDPNSCRTTARR